MLRVISYFWLVIVLVIGLLLAINNPTLISLSFAGFSTPELPIFLWLIFFLLIGVIIGVLGSVPARIRHRRTVKLLNERLTRLQTPESEDVVELT